MGDIPGSRIFDKSPKRVQIPPMRSFFLAGLIVGATLLVGCGGKPGPNAKPAPKVLPGPTDAEIPVTMEDKTQVVTVTADDTMHFNGDRFTVQAGQPVRVELTNKGVRPATEMAHNFVVLKPNVDAVAFNLACAQAKSNAYLPASESDKVLSFTSLAGPGETVTANFNAPAPGQYTFLCNFPGHYAGGMHGTMTVIAPKTTDKK